MAARGESPQPETKSARVCLYLEKVRLHFGLLNNRTFGSGFNANGPLSLEARKSVCIVIDVRCCGMSEGVDVCRQYVSIVPEAF